MPAMTTRAAWPCAAAGAECEIADVSHPLHKCLAGGGESPRYEAEICVPLTRGGKRGSRYGHRDDAAGRAAMAGSHGAPVVSGGLGRGKRQGASTRAQPQHEAPVPDDPAVITCHRCPAELRRAIHLERDEWIWVDQTGRQFGDDPDLPPDPYGHLNALSDRMAASGYTDQAAAAEYSALTVRLDFGGTFHEHYPDGEPAYAGPAAPPDHCGWPLRHRPSGWYCRRCARRQDVPLADEIAAVVAVWAAGSAADVTRARQILTRRVIPAPRLVKGQLPR
jgi:hypothetical protein